MYFVAWTINGEIAGMFSKSYPTREEAEKARDELRAQYGVNRIFGDAYKYVVIEKGEYEPYEMPA